MEIPYDFNGQYNQCYTFYIRFNDCVASEPLKRIMCSDKFNDYFECKTHIKEMQYRSWYAKEYKKIKILSLPKYDDQTDSFIDGVGYDNSVDSFFNNDEKMKKFFDLHKGFKKEPHHHGSH